MTQPLTSAKPSRFRTATAVFGTCHDAHPPMFSVRAGIEAEDALVCALAAVKAAYETNALALEQADDPLRNLLTASENSLEKGRALLEAVLDGVEGEGFWADRRPSGAGLPRDLTPCAEQQMLQGLPVILRWHMNVQWFPHRGASPLLHLRL